MEEILGIISKCLEVMESKEERATDQWDVEDWAFADLVDCGYIKMIDEDKWRVTLKGAEWYWKWLTLREIAKNFKDI